MQGATIPAVCRRHGFSEQIFWRLRLKVGALTEDEAHRLKALGAENGDLPE